MPEVRLNRDGDIVSIKSQRNYEPNQELTTAKEKHNSFNKATAVGVLFLMLFGGVIINNYIDNKRVEKKINDKVTQADLSVSKDKLVKEKLQEARIAFNQGYTNKDTAFNFYEQQVLTAANNGTLKDISNTSSEVRDVLWSTAVQQPNTDSDNVIKEANIQKAEEVLKARRDADAKYNK